MRVTPDGQSEYRDGNEIGRYGRDISTNTYVLVWYHDGLRSADEPAWAMDPDVHFQLPVSLDYILVPSADNGLYAIDADAFGDEVEYVGTAEQYVARASDPYVEQLGDPNDHLSGNLWITAENGHGGYHKDNNEA